VLKCPIDVVTLIAQRQTPMRQPQKDTSFSVNKHQQLCLQYELSLLVLLRALVGLVVFPSYDFLALAAGDVPYNMSTRCHDTLGRIGAFNVGNFVEEVSFSMLPSEASADDIFMGRKMGLARLAAVNLIATKVGIVCEPHRDGSRAE